MPQARKMATERVGDELERARGVVSRAAKAEAKKERKVFIDEITVKRRMLKERVARNKLRKETCKEVRAKMRALKKRVGHV